MKDPADDVILTLEQTDDDKIDEEKETVDVDERKDVKKELKRICEVGGFFDPSA